MITWGSTEDESAQEKITHVPGRNLFYFLHVHKSPYCFSKWMLLKNGQNHQDCKTSRTQLKEAALWSSGLLPRHPYSHLASGLPENGCFPPSGVSYQQIPTKFLTLSYFLSIQIPSLCYLHFVPLGFDPQALDSPGILVPSPDAPVSWWPGLPWLVPQALAFSSRVLEPWLLLLFLPALGSLICQFTVCTSWWFAPCRPVPVFLCCTGESASGAHVTW